MRAPSFSFPSLLLFVLLATLAGLAMPAPARAAHALALGGEPKYPPDFNGFSYANPGAPRGGSVTLSGLGSFDKLNPFTLKGTAATGLSELVFETLTIASLDEPMSMYGLLAEDMELAPDRLSITFRLRPQARFSNGDPVTADDVKYSFDTLRSPEASPLWRQYWADVSQAVVVDPRTIRFEFARLNRELHMIVGSVPVFSRKWAAGRPFDQVIRDLPVASGAYVVESVDLGKRITYRRNPDWWGHDVPARRGSFNFERVTYVYFLDEFARLESFRAGSFDFIHENAAKNWARSYVGRRFDDGTLVKTELPHSNPQGIQGLFFNTRRPQFADARVRRALGLAFDFEWMNRQLFFGQYKRAASYFTSSDMAATGLPDADELALLEPYRAELPAEVFGPAVVPPVTEPPPASLRDNLRQARALLAQAGWTYRDGALRDAQGTPLRFEVLLHQRGHERVIAPLARNLARLGVQADIRTIDASLFRKRTDEFDFDMIVNWYLSTQSPGNELGFRFTSQAADEQGSDNFAGVKSTVVDALIARILAVETRAELVTACRALDRVLRAGYYAIPEFYNNVHRVAYRDRFGRPAHEPLYYDPSDWFVEFWWERPAGGQG